MKRHHTSAVLVTDTRHKRLLGICTERDIVFGWSQPAMIRQS